MFVWTNFKSDPKPCPYFLRNKITYTGASPKKKKKKNEYRGKVQEVLWNFSTIFKFFSRCTCSNYTFIFIFLQIINRDEMDEAQKEPGV